MKILSLTRGVHADETGWSFKIDFEDEMTPVSEYRTNKNYEGLFVWQDSTQSWSQAKGNGQFSLSENEPTAKKQIVGHFSKR
jgi:hypothetical protein